MDQRSGLAGRTLPTLAGVAAVAAISGAHTWSGSFQTSRDSPATRSDIVLPSKVASIFASPFTRLLSVK